MSCWHSTVPVNTPVIHFDNGSNARLHDRIFLGNVKWIELWSDNMLSNFPAFQSLG